MRCMEGLKMNWLQKISDKKLIHEIELRGWAEEQLNKDALNVWRDNDKFFFSVGDWANVNTDDITAAIEYTYPNSSVSWDFEAGPPEGWEKVI